jgi:predicted dehydrogenase
MHCAELASRADKFRIVAACDVDAARLERMKQRYGCRTYARVEDLVRDADVELVAVATRSVDHVRHACLALKAGKAVFQEKPIAASYAEARKLVRCAAACRGRLFARHNRRFEPAFQQIRKMIADGLLGNVYEVKLRRHHFARRDDWQTLKAFAGGQLNNWGPHIVDHALQLLGAPVADVWGDLKKVAAVGDAEDHLKIVLRGRNGRVVDLEISGGAALPEPEYIVFGDRGALVCDGQDIKLRYLKPGVPVQPRKADPTTPPSEGSFGTPDALTWVRETVMVASPTGEDTPSIWDHLYAALRQGKPFPITLDEALEVVRVIDRVRQGTPFAR